MIYTVYFYEDYPKVQRDAMIARDIVTWERAIEIAKEYDRLTKETTGS